MCATGPVKPALLMPDANNAPRSAGAESPEPLRIALLAGEASGDQLGANLIDALRARFPQASFVGMAGPRMRAAGCEALAEMEELNVMGLVEILRHYPRLRRLRARLTRELTDWRPHVVVGIDVPDFTLWIERRLKDAGSLAVHYVCPQVWAWRAGRIPHIRRSINLMLTLFPFEAPFLRQHGIDATFVGHPLADRIPLHPDRQQLRRALGLAADAEWVALMPGSRRQELQRHVDLFLQTASLLHHQRPAMRFVAGAVHARAAAFIRTRHAALAPQLPLEIIEGRASDVLLAADAALVVSGTISLESALCGTPAVVAYRLAALSYWWLRRAVKVAHIALPNLLLSRRLFPEFVQDEAHPAALAGALAQWLDDAAAREDCRRSCEDLHQTLARSAGPSAAQAIAQSLAARGVASA